MEINNPNKENHRFMIVSSSSHAAADGGHVKSFRCTFCNRGFSNAQALGGHMNIHRKDRAKLKQSYCEEDSFLFLDEATNNKNLSDDKGWLLELDSGTDHDDGRCSQERTTLTLATEDASKDDGDAIIPKRRKENIGEWLQLPLFTEKPYIIKEVGEKQMNRSSQNSSSQTTEVDLELRLGPQPPLSAAIARKLF